MSPANFVAFAFSGAFSAGGALASAFAAGGGAAGGLTGILSSVAHDANTNRVETATALLIIETFFIEPLPVLLRL
jgi:hypothetical protein